MTKFEGTTDRRKAGQSLRTKACMVLYGNNASDFIITKSLVQILWFVPETNQTSMEIADRK